MPANDIAEQVSARAGVGGVPSVDELVDGLRRIAATLPAHQPDPADGLVWAQYDAALSGLYNAIVALGEVQRLSHGARRPAAVVERRVGLRPAEEHRHLGGRGAARPGPALRPPAIA